MNRFELTSALAEEILAHSRECSPEEACGIIAGAGNRGSSLCRGQNRSSTPRVAFELDTETLARQLDFEAAGMTLAAIYHSHPAGPERPSELDIRRAIEGYPDSVHIVCSLADHDKPALRAFRIGYDRASEISLIQGVEATT
jgi:proteasome lid subunit RPN8/RPN11